jgi:hypothetical protein
MALERVRNLAGGQYQAAGRVDDEIEGASLPKTTRAKTSSTAVHRGHARARAGAEEPPSHPVIEAVTWLAAAEDQVGRALGDGDRRGVHHGLR